MEKTKDQHIQQQEQELANQETGLSLELSGLIKLNKEEIAQGVDLIKQRVEDGLIDPLDALIIAKKGKESYDQIEKAIRPLAEEKIYGKDYARHGVLVEEANIGARWDYKPCQDPLLESLELRVKERQKFLQTVKKPTKIDFVDEVTGDVTEHEIYPAIKSHGRLGLKLTIK